MREVEKIFAKVTAWQGHISVRDDILWRKYKKSAKQNTGDGRGFCSDVLVEFIVTVNTNSVRLECSGDDRSRMRFWELHDAFKTAMDSRADAKAKQSEEKADEVPSRYTLTRADNNDSATHIRRGRPENSRTHEMAILAGAVATNHDAFKYSKDLQVACWTIVNDVSENNYEIRRNAMKILAECAKYGLLTVQNPEDKKTLQINSRELHFQFSELQKHLARSKRLFLLTNSQ